MKSELRKPLSFIVKFYYLKIIYKYFSNSNKLEYCFVRQNKYFPNLKEGSDIDIYLLESSNLLEDLINYLKSRNILKFKVFTISKNIVHIDLLFKDRLIIKLDFCLNKINNSLLKPNNNLLYQTILNSRKFSFKYAFDKFEISFPNQDFDNLTRYMEYKLYPSKQHHLNKLNKISIDQQLELSKLVKEYLGLELELTLFKKI